MFFKKMFETLFYQPILNLLIFLYNVVPGQDIGIAIILLTVIIKLILLPLSKKSIKSQKALQDLQPKIEKLKVDYKGKQEEMGRKMMELYKENKVNPFSSCLPLLVQMPFLFAVFRVFRNGFEDGALEMVYPFISRPEVINQISFLGNLGEKNIMFAVLAGLAQFWQSKMMMTKRPAKPLVDGSKDEDMMAIMNKQMLYVMPLMTMFIAMSFEGGLALYWLTTTLLQVVQQHFLFKSKDEKEEPKPGDEKKIVEGEIEEVKEDK